ncbi:MAG: hypothetical protein K9I94_14740 [Bacteroidales bacterium]|nr:hypothetical protein [Bacteroidales bacterium]
MSFLGRAIWVISIIIMIAGLVQCTKPPKEVPKDDHQTTEYNIQIPPYFPNVLEIPADNPLTVEGVELGRYLFYDGRVSGRTHPDSLMSCGTCHKQDNTFEAGPERAFPVGMNGDHTHHVMLPLINLVWNFGQYGWNGSVGSLEEMVLAVMTDPFEFNSSYEQIEQTISGIPGYPGLFEKAFGTPEVTAERIAKAIAQFVRTLVSGNSKFDRYLWGETELTSQELHGFILFTTEEGADCFHCHGGGGNPLFTTHLFYNNGKDTVFNDPHDRYAITGDPMDKGAYKAPTLRNIEWTAPYMHDGRFETLDEVIDFYSHHLQWSPQIDPLMHHIANGGVQLTPTEKASLKAFIRTLADSSFVTNPEYDRPDTFPDGNTLKSYPFE